MEKLICLKEFCGKPYYAKGYCRNHYEKILRGKIHRICSIDGCNLKYVARGFCRIHYYLNVERKSKKEYAPHIEKTRILCKYCDEITFCKDVCKKHYYMSKAIINHD